MDIDAVTHSLALAVGPEVHMATAMSGSGEYRLYSSLEAERLKQSTSLAAAPEGTILFSAPLYRKNLHYTVVPKPASAQDSIRIMCDYILKHHSNDTGIVYCLTKKVIRILAQSL